MSESDGVVLQETGVRSERARTCALNVYRLARVTAETGGTSERASERTWRTHDPAARPSVRPSLPPI